MFGLLTPAVTGNRIVQTAVRSFYPIGAVRKIRRGPLKGLKFKVNQGMGFTYAWGIGFQWGFGRFVRPGMCVYDIGANCGQSTLSLARAVGPTGRVVAFEPVSTLFENLVHNIRINELSQVTPICRALHDRSGTSNSCPAREIHRVA